MSSQTALATKREANFHLSIYVLIFILNSLLIYLIFSSPDFGSRDFRAFWCAGRASNLSFNPYTIQGLKSVSDAICVNNNVQWFLNPPPALLIGKSLALLDFNSAKITFALCNILLLFLSALIITRLANVKLPEALLALYLFPASIECIYFGQFSILVLFFSLLLFFFYRNKSILPSSFCFILCCLKPQINLAHLINYALGKTQIIKKLFITFIFSSLIIFLIEILHPSIWNYWSNREFSGTTWLTSSLASLFRIFILDNLKIAFICTLGLSLLSTFCLMQTSAEKTSLTYWCKLSIISVILTPYIWPYDFVLLAPLQALLISLSTDYQDKLSTIIQLMFFHCLTLIFRIYYPDMIWMLFYPIILSLYAVKKGALRLKLVFEIINRSSEL